MTDAVPAEPIDAASQAPKSVAARTLAAPRWAVIGIFLLLALQATAIARAFLVPVVLAVLLTLVFSPMRRFLQRRRVGPGLAAALIVSTLLAAFVAGVLALAAPAAEWVENAPMIGRRLEAKMQELRGAAEGMREAAEQVDQIAGGGTDPAADEPERVLVDETGYVANFALTVPSVLAQMLFTLTLLYFLLASGDMFYEKIVHALPTFRDKRRAIQIAHDIERKLSRYLFTISVINAALGLFIGLSMWAIGMPNPLLFGVLGFLLNFIPYVGAIIGTAMVLAVGMVSFDTMQQAFAAAGVYFALTSIEGQLVTPYFVGRSLQLNTVVVFLSVTLWAWLWSVVGMLLATPLLVALRTLCEHIPSLEAFGNFLSARGEERSEEKEAAGPAPADADGV